MYADSASDAACHIQYVEFGSDRCKSMWNVGWDSQPGRPLHCVLISDVVKQVVQVVYRYCIVL